MIKFFRHIRQSLIMENKTSKYLKYAIGEIVLVVIGILIALQINNWNESRKANENLIQLFERTQKELLYNIEHIMNIYRMNEYIMNYNKICTSNNNSCFLKIDRKNPTMLIK